MPPDLKHIWDARVHIAKAAPIPFLSAFTGAALGAEMGGAPAMYIGSVIGTFIGSRIEDKMTKRHEAQYTSFNSDDPRYQLEENGCIVARVASAAIVPVLMHLVQ